MNAFLNSKIMSELHYLNDFEKICVLASILQQSIDFNYGQQQKYITDYIKYCHQQRGK